MNLLGWLQSIFPPPRKPVTIESAWSLIIFLIAFVAFCFTIDVVLNWVTFTQPWAFALLLLLPWFWWVHEHGFSGLLGWRAHVALATRLTVAGIFIMLLAEPRSVRQSDHLQVLFVMDTSASMGQQTSSEALKYITNAVAEKPSSDEIGLVVFGRDAAVELPPSQSFPLEAILLEVDRDGTNIEKGLSLASAMLTDDVQGRIVLVSDGVNTEGNLPRVLDELKSRSIPVDVLPRYYEYEKEVWVERLELPRSVKAGESYEAAVIVSSLTPGTGELLLQENGEEIFRQKVEYREGKNRYVIPIYMREPGYYEYTAMLEAAEGEDSIRRNNKAISYLYLKGEGKVLLVADPGGDRRDHRQLARALSRGERKVVVQEPFEFPTEPLALMPYDCVVFVNVPRDAFVSSQLDAVRDAVYNQGVGFLMVGGENSYGPGGYHRTPIEEALPVTMDITHRKVLPKGALAIILHTCEFANGNTWGKRITKEAIKVLGTQDEVGVLVYDWTKGESWLFTMTPAGEYNRLVPIIEGAQIGDMPSFAPTMQLGFQGLKNVDASAKHMIIISDGDPQPPAPALMKQFIAEKISVSTVAVFPHGNDTRVLQSIAKATGGEFYFPNDPNKLPQIFIKEAKTLKRSMLQNRTFTPLVQHPSPVIKNIDGFPELHGYVLTSDKKSRTQTILQTPPNEEGEQEPVLSTWRFGLGKTAAWTSDLSANWAKNWVEWDRYQPFVNQLVTDIARISDEGHLRLQTFAVGNTGLVVIEDHAPERAMLDVTVEATLPNETSMAVPMQQTGPRRYEGRFPLEGTGRYQLMGVGLGEGRKDRVHGGFVVPYSREYLRFRADPVALETIATHTGGRTLSPSDMGETLFEVDRTPRSRSQPIFDWCLFLLALLIPVDVGIRRVQPDFERIKQWLGLTRRAAPSDETFDALRKRKEAVSSTMQRAEGSSPADEPKPRQRTEPATLASLKSRRDALAEKQQAEQKRTQPGRAAAKPQPGATAEGDDTSSTTGRLLALRRKQRGDTPPKDNDGAS